MTRKRDKMSIKAMTIKLAHNMQFISTKFFNELGTKIKQFKYLQL